MAGFANIEVNKDYSYSASFGNSADGTVYSDPLGTYQRLGLKSDLRPQWAERVNQRLAEMKAIGTTTGGTGLTDNVLIPISHDNRVVDLTRKQTPAVEMIRRVTNKGIVAPYKQITAKSTAFFAIENAALPESDFTPDVQSVNIKYMYAVGNTSGPLNAAAPAHTLMGFEPTGGAVGSFSDAAAPNAGQLNVLVQARALRELEEDTIFNGDAATNPEEYSGIIVTLGATNTVDKNSTALDLNDYLTASRNAFDDGGIVNVAFCDTSTFVDTQKLLTAKQGFFQGAKVNEFGVTSIKIDTISGQIDLIPSRFLSTTSGAKSVYLLDLSVWEMRVLQDMTFEKLGKTNDADRFMLKMYEALICLAPQFNASITEIL